MEKIAQKQIHQYLSKLKNSLNQLPRTEREEIIQEVLGHIEDHLQTSLESNRDKAVQDILSSLGNPKTYAHQIVEQRYQHIQQSGGWLANLRGIWQEMRWPFLIAVIIQTVILEFNTWWLYGDFLKAGQAFWTEFLKISLGSLPAIGVVTFPTALSIGVAVAFGEFINVRVNPTIIRSLKLWSMVLFIGVSSTVLSFGLNDLLVPQSNSMIVDTNRQLIQRQNPNHLMPQKTEFYELSSWQLFQIIKQGYIDAPIPKWLTAEDLNKAHHILSVKFALPMLCLVVPFVGALVGILAATGLFNKTIIYIFFAGLGVSGFPYFCYAQSETNSFLVWLPFATYGLLSLIMLTAIATAPVQLESDDA